MAVQPPPRKPDFVQVAFEPPKATLQAEPEPEPARKRSRSMQQQQQVPPQGAAQRLLDAENHRGAPQRAPHSTTAAVDANFPWSMKERAAGYPAFRNRFMGLHRKDVVTAGESRLERDMLAASAALEWHRLTADQQAAYMESRAAPPTDPRQLPPSQWTTETVTAFLTRQPRDVRNEPLLLDVTHCRRWGRRQRLQLLAHFKASGSPDGSVAVAVWVRHDALFPNPTYAAVLERRHFKPELLAACPALLREPEGRGNGEPKRDSDFTEHDPSAAVALPWPPPRDHVVAAPT